VIRRPAVIVALVLLGCGGGKQLVSNSRTIVSLVPSVTEIVFALGAGDRLVGVTNQCDYPGEAWDKFRVGDLMNPDIERIAALKPGLVAATLPVHQALVPALEELGLAVYVSEPRSLDEVFGEIDSLGWLLGRHARAKFIVDSLRQVLDAVPAAGDTPTVYVEVSIEPLMAAGAGSFLNEAVFRAGGKNVFGRVVRDFVLVDPEQVLAADPDVIVLLHPGASRDDVMRRLGWSGISAVRNGRVFDDIDEDLLVRPGPRLVAGIIQLRQKLASSDNW
jgi:iron complex transport system substrate-binding protein